MSTLPFPSSSINPKQGWSGGGGGSTVTSNAFTFGLVSDGDTLAERYAGIMARYENTHSGHRPRALPLRISRAITSSGTGTTENALAQQPHPAT